jgi:DNA polymerase III sliding clamp (beta) subunit (PCNA family)
MRFKILQTDLAKYLRFADKISNPNAISVSEKHLKLELTGNNLTLTCASSTGSFIFVFPVYEGIADGLVCVSSKEIFKQVQTYDKDDCLEFHLNEDILHLKVRKGKTKFKTLNSANYRIISGTDVLSHYEVDVTTVADLISKSVFCVSKDDDRFKCVQLKSTATDLTSYATDGFRTITAFLPHKSTEFSVVIPQATIRDMLSGLALVSGSAKLSFSNNLVIEGADFKFVGNLNSFGFPEIKLFDNIKSEGSFSFVKKSLHSLMARAVAASEDDIFYISLNLAGNTLNCQIKTDLVEIDEDVDVSNPHNGQFEVGFNGKFLFEFLRTLEDDAEVEMIKQGFICFFLTEKLKYAMVEVKLS